MRRLIIDTDTGSDDAVALIMALKSEEVHIEAITTVCGNVPLDLATKNALMTIEVANGQKPPLYIGSEKPLMRELVTAVGVHGEDGMGDCDLIHPTLKANEGHAVDTILELVKKYPNEIEIITIGPATNIALAIMKEPQTMKLVKHIYSMGTAGFGYGNTTAVSEFNVYVDAEAYKKMIELDVPKTIIGFDVCLGEAALIKEDTDMLLNSGVEEAIYAVKCNKTLLEYNQKKGNGHMIDLPDAVAMAVVLWPEVVIEASDCHCHVCTKEEVTYGQVIIDDFRGIVFPSVEDPNATVIKKFDAKVYKEKLKEILTK